MRNKAPSSVAFTRTSRSMGKLIPKLSASVNVSCSIPVQCLDMVPISSCPLAVRTCMPEHLSNQNGCVLTTCSGNMLLVGNTVFIDHVPQKVESSETG